VKWISDWQLFNSSKVDSILWEANYACKLQLPSIWVQFRSSLHK